MEIYVSNFIPIIFTFIGYYCSKFLRFGTNKRLIRVILGISFLLTLATQILLKDIGVGYRVYSYPFGILLSFSTFHFLGSLSTSNQVNRIAYLLSSYSLGFYYIHRLVLKMMVDYIYINKALTSLVNTILSLLISAVIIFIMKKVRLKILV